MANYGYIPLRPRPTEDAFEQVLREAVGRALKGPWQIQRTTWQDDGTVWFVHLPGTALDEAGAREASFAPGQDFGFPVALQRGRVAFRHGFNFFLSWAQGCIEEELADHYRKGVVYDATNRTTPPGTRDRRKGSFYAYLRRNFKTVTAADEAFFERSFRNQTPAGFWKGEEHG